MTTLVGVPLRRHGRALARTLAAAHRGRRPSRLTLEEPWRLTPARARAASRASGAPGPVPGRALRRAPARPSCAEFARVQVFGEVCEPARLRGAASTSSCATRDGAVPCAMWRDDFDALAPAGRRSATAPRSSSPAGPTTTRAAARPRRRSPSPSPGCASRARATCSPSSSALRRRLAPRGCSSRRSACRGRRCRAASASSPARAARPATTSSPGCAAAAGRAGWCGRSRPCRTAAPRPRSRARSRPRRDRRGRGDRRRARRRLAGRPVRLLRRGAVPDGGAAARAGDRLGRPPHRPHADRRRRRRRPARRRRTPRRSAVPLQRRARRARDAAARCARARSRDHGAPRGARTARRRARRALPRAGRARRPPRAAPAPAAARAAGQRARRGGSSSARHGRGACWSSSARRRAALAPKPARAPRRAGRRWRWRWLRTTPSARSSAATRWSTDRAGEPITLRRGRPRRARASTLRFARRRRCPRARTRRRPVSEPSADLRGRDRPAGGDHPPPGLRRGGPARDARPRARRAAGSSSSARPSSTPSAAGCEELRLDELVARLETARPPQEPTLEHLGPARRPAAAHRRLRAGGRSSATCRSDFTRQTTAIRLQRRRRGRRRRGRHLRRRRPRRAAGRRAGAAARRRVDARVASASTWRSSTSSRSRRSARCPASTACGRTSPRRSTWRCARPARRCTRCWAASRGR